MCHLFSLNIDYQKHHDGSIHVMVTQTLRMTGQELVKKQSWSHSSWCQPEAKSFTFLCCLVKITVQLLLEKVDSKKFTSCFVLGVVVVIFHAYNDCFLLRESHESENDETGVLIALNVI